MAGSNPLIDILQLEMRDGVLRCLTGCRECSGLLAWPSLLIRDHVESL